MTDLDKLEALAKAATSGPWEVGDDGPILYEGMQRPVWNIYGGRNFVDARLVGSIEHFQGDDYPNANAAFIAAANPATILDLIASARRDAEEIERLRARFAELADDFERRADACHDLNKSDKEQRDRMRLHGKEAAYRHAMVLARAAHTGEG